MKKFVVGILFGGRSSEHEVSRLSAQNVIAALDRQRFDPLPIEIDKKGTWVFRGEPLSLTLKAGSRALFFTPKNKLPLDVVFPVLHGPYGEDGTIQGLLEVINIPYVGAGVLGSAIGMDKEVQKILFQDHGIPTPHFEVIRAHEWKRSKDECTGRIANSIGFPCFVKPANLGSSVGVNKVKKREDLLRAITEAFFYDTKILVEEFIKGREVFCGVIGNEEPLVSLPGEVIPHREFYDYFAKYLSSATELKVPIPLNPRLQGKVMRLAAEVYRAAFCEGMARVDFFLTAEEDLTVIEINTIPGFTDHSMFPKIWEASGLSFQKLLNTLVELALERWQKRQSVKMSFNQGGLLKGKGI